MLALPDKDMYSKSYSLPIDESEYFKQDIQQYPTTSSINPILPLDFIIIKIYLCIRYVRMEIWWYSVKRGAIS